MTRPVFVIAAATLVPIPFLLAGTFWGGAWIFCALFSLTALAVLLDSLAVKPPRPVPDMPKPKALAILPIILGLAHYLLLAIAVWTISATGTLSGLEKAGLFAAFGIFFGQVSNSVAHELIHCPRRGARRLGTWIYISLLFGHHASAHPRIHHRFVGTLEDPNTARLGESFYAFALRAWSGSYAAGLRAESTLLAMRYDTVPVLRHPYTLYTVGSAVVLAAAAAIGGGAGVLTLIGLALYAQLQLLLSDYVQHYGLVRQYLPSGKPEPIAVRHSWNAPDWYSSSLMLNAPRHSDHHANPTRPYAQLELPPEEITPVLPRSLPVMAAIALVPPLWRRMMDPLAAEWRVGLRPPVRMAAE